MIICIVLTLFPVFLSFVICSFIFLIYFSLSFLLSVFPSFLLFFFLSILLLLLLFVLFMLGVLLRRSYLYCGGFTNKVSRARHARMHASRHACTHACMHARMPRSHTRPPLLLLRNYYDSCLCTMRRVQLPPSACHTMLQLCDFRHQQPKKKYCQYYNLVFAILSSVGS